MKTILWIGVINALCAYFFVSAYNHTWNAMAFDGTSVIIMAILWIVGFFEPWMVWYLDPDRQNKPTYKI